MGRKRCLRLGLLVGSLPAVLLAFSAGAVISKERAEDGDQKVFFPPNRAVLLSGSFDVICKAKQATLEVDGKQHQWEGFKPPLRVSRVTLAPGLHELKIGSRRLEVVVALNEDEHEGPKDCKIIRNHPAEAGERRCEACHKTDGQGGQISVGELKSYEACLKCHTAIDFEVAHSHPLEPLEACQMCHDLHRSDRKALLKAPLKKLCADCHDS